MKKFKIEKVLNELLLFKGRNQKKNWKNDKIFKKKISLDFGSDVELFLKPRRLIINPVHQLLHDYHRVNWFTP